MPFQAEPVSLTREERQELTRMSLSRSLPAGDVMRAHMILMLAAGRSYADIQKRLRTTAPTISRWTHWSVRKLARELNISKDAVHRIWRAAGVKPHRLERYMAPAESNATVSSITGMAHYRCTPRWT